MPVKLPPDIVEQYWSLCRGELAPELFEAWIEARLDGCEDAIPRQDRLLLRATDYDDSEQMDHLRAWLWQSIISSNAGFPIEAFGYTTTPRKVVRFFSAICTACGARFPVPHLGDFSYGLFILTARNGRAFAYFEAIANPIWEMIQSLVAEVMGDSSSQEESLDLLQEVLACCADPFSGETFTHRDICPVCGEESSVYLSDMQVYNGTIPVASFRAFGALTRDERRAMIAAIIKGIEIR